MITRLRIENFKSWRDTGELHFAPLTGFFGSNSSGKTGILQFLLTLKQTVDSPDRIQPLDLGDDRSFVELGTFQELIFRHERDRVLHWQIGWEHEAPIRVEEGIQGRRLSHAAQVRAVSPGAMQVSSFRYGLDGHDFIFDRERPGAPAYEGSSPFEFCPSGNQLTGKPTPVKCYGFPSQVRFQFQNANFLGDLEFAFEELFNGVFYLGPLREYPKRQYTWASRRPSDMGHRGEHAVEALLAASEDSERSHVLQLVAQWLHQLGLIHEFQITRVSEGSNLYQVKVRKTKTGPEVLLTDVGFGVSQILPVLVLCYYAPEGSTLILEQPEIHLHPSVQAGLADVFIDAIQKRGIQILLESHSEYLLKRLQRRIAETEGQYDQFTHDDVALYFCSMKREASQAEPLDVDEVGNITNWPQDFFGDEMADLAARTRAAARRKKALAG